MGSKFRISGQAVVTFPEVMRPALKAGNLVC
jgi:hypothetical protein